MGGIGTFTKEMVFHLARQILTSAQIGQVEAVLIDQHGLVFQPSGPSFFADAFPDAFAQVARVGREVQAFGLFFKLDAVDSACHENPCAVQNKGVTVASFFKLPLDSFDWNGYS